MDHKIDIEGYIGKWTLVLGDVNTGKTTFSARILKAMCDAGLAARIAVIDLAPEVPRQLAEKRGLRGVGGRLVPPAMTEVIYLSTRLEAPRLSSRNEEEAEAKAGRNRQKIESLFDDFNRFNRDILLINDVSMYLQAGTAEELIKMMKKASTLIANGYFGERLGGSVISERERREMESLMRYMETKVQVIWKK